MKALGTVRRKPVTATPAELVSSARLLPDRPLPLLVSPTAPGVDLVAWSADCRDRIEDWLLATGAVLLRGFKPLSVAEFEQVIANVSGELLEYRNRSTPRSLVAGNIHTSTEYPADQTIPSHNEMSYSNRWPLKLWFACFEASDTGGETPLSDSRRIYEAIDPAIRERFMEHGVMYVRNYVAGLDLTWQDVFQTDEPGQVEEYCRANGIEFEWLSEDHLRTRQVCQAAAKHPKTGDPVWFNQAHLFHISNVPADTRKALLATVKEENLSRNAYYGDGSRIDDDDLAAIREVYARERIKFPWQQGDVMVIDNMLTTHGREPFTGTRRVYVGMAESWDQPGI